MLWIASSRGALEARFLAQQADCGMRVRVAGLRHLHCPFKGTLVICMYRIVPALGQKGNIEAYLGM